jgi:hypothetical protein
MATVTVTPITGFQHALQMRWDKVPSVPDVNQAFDEILKSLNAADQKIYVLVDISDSPRFPLAVTITHASQIHRHPNMGDWLVIGSSAMAKFIGTTISSLSSSKVIWFQTQEAALQHLANVTT